MYLPTVIRGSLPMFGRTKRKHLMGHMAADEDEGKAEPELLLGFLKGQQAKAVLAVRNGKGGYFHCAGVGEVDRW